VLPDVFEARESTEGLQTLSLTGVQDRRRVVTSLNGGSLSSIEQEVELLLVKVRIVAAQLDLGEEDGEGEVVGMEEGSRRALEDVEEEVANEDR
jgi:hypothetical protein